MRIYKMTATFGKLENQTLQLQPGLNIISAPNEWGKSTWCAFLATMLYGLETKERTKKDSLALKERYAPWSGSPMSGRIDLSWNGRDITIERWTKGRTPLGEFRAYETQSGLAVPELTGAGCGETLLGVERSVFLRAGFIRLADLPVTADESLRRRLNALVTTGDESGAGDALAQKLKDLKNKVRYNRSGLLPQAEQQRNELQGKLAELESLQAQSEALQQRLSEAQGQMAQLENHRAALAFDAAQEQIRKVEAAHLAAEAAAEAMAKAEDACQGLPLRETAMEQLSRHAQLLQTQSELLRQWDALPPEPALPQVSERYRGLTPEEAIARAEADTKTYTSLEESKRKNGKLLMGYAAAAALLVLLGLVIGSGGGWIAIGAAIALGGVGVLLACKQRADRIYRSIEALFDRYPGTTPSRWVEDAAVYAESQRQYGAQLEHALALRRSIRSRIDGVEDDLTDLMQGLPSREFLLSRNEILEAHDALADARRVHQQAAAHAAALGAMVKAAPQPAQPDSLTLSEAATIQALSDLDFEMKQLQLRLGKSQGRMDALGSAEGLQHQLDAVNARIEKLNQFYSALELAQQTLQNATAELQRRFAPRISQQAQEIFGQLTGGRYDRLQLQQDLSVNAAAAEDVAIRSAQWRSEGTIDQLYLALRLAVARELTADAPLVLDDALVRFDDTRHTAAMEILRQEAESKQVILFTCQSRESN